MKKKLLGLCVVAALSLSVQAADDTEVKPVSFTLDAGINLMNDISVGGGDVEMDSGFGLAIGASYNLNKTFSLGLETGLRYNQVKDVDEVCLYQMPLLATIGVRYENDSKFVPYASLGVGGAMGILDVDVDTASDFVFAWQIEAGLRYKISDSLSAGVSYRYLGLGDQEYDFGGGAVAEIEDVSSHMIGLSIRWSF